LARSSSTCARANAHNDTATTMDGRRMAGSVPAPAPPARGGGGNPRHLSLRL
jgi:hypothetical protein